MSYTGTITMTEQEHKPDHFKKPPTLVLFSKVIPEENDVDVSAGSSPTSPTLTTKSEPENREEGVRRRSKQMRHVKSVEGDFFSDISSFDSPKTTFSSSRSMNSLSSVGKRSSLFIESNNLQVKRNTSFIRKSTIGVQGTFFQLEKDQFDDFPEFVFKELPTLSLSLDKRQQKELDSLIQSIRIEREQFFNDRSQAVKQQQKREEKLMRDFQDEINARATRKYQDFERELKQSKREKKLANESMSKSEVQQLHKSFEVTTGYELQYKQQDLENRLIKQRLHWIRPWLRKMQGIDEIHLSQLHSMEAIFLEEIQRSERIALEDKEDEIAKFDMQGFLKELQQTKKDRKHANRPMSKEELEWEKEVFKKSQAERFAENMKKLEEHQFDLRNEVESQQERQIHELQEHYNQLFKMVTPDNTIHSSFQSNTSLDGE